MGLLLVLWGGLSALAGPPLKLPGRAPDSAEPWGFFLGRAAHVAIGLQYRVQYPTHTVFLNSSNLLAIVSKGKLGNPDRLSEFVKSLSPDIVDVNRLMLFEIKPDNQEKNGAAAEQAIKAAYKVGEWPIEFEGQVYLPADCL